MVVVLCLQVVLPVVQKLSPDAYEPVVEVVVVVLTRSVCFHVDSASVVGNVEHMFDYFAVSGSL